MRSIAVRKFGLFSGLTTHNVSPSMLFNDIRSVRRLRLVSGEGTASDQFGESKVKMREEGDPLMQRNCKEEQQSDKNACCGAVGYNKSNLKYDEGDCSLFSCFSPSFGKSLGVGPYARARGYGDSHTNPHLRCKSPCRPLIDLSFCL